MIGLPSSTVKLVLTARFFSTDQGELENDVALAGYLILAISDVFRFLETQPT